MSPSGKIYFSADQHFDDVNVLKYCHRPYGSVFEMNHDMVLKWNAVVKPEDHVWHLGDFSRDRRSLRFVRHLQGKKWFIPGNHDGCFPHAGKANQELVQEYKDAGFEEVFCEAVRFGPFLLWHLPYLGDRTPVDRYKDMRPINDGCTPILHGHVHSAWVKKGRCINVGVDVWNFAPVELGVLKAVLADPREKIDHWS